MNKKRGVSEIVSYVLLVIIAVSISVFVFAFLKLYVPKEKPECKEGINLIIEDIKCNIVGGEGKLTVLVQNRGRFNIDASYLRIGKVDRTFRKNLFSDVIFTPPLEPDKSIFLNNSDTQLGMITIGSADVNEYGTPDGANIKFILEVQPGFLTGRGVDSLALCNKISQTITCTPA